MKLEDQLIILMEQSILSLAVFREKKMGAILSSVDVDIVEELSKWGMIHMNDVFISCGWLLVNVILISIL